MFSIDEGGRASLIAATSKTGGTAVCPNHTIRANSRFIIGRLSVRSLPRLKSQRGGFYFRIRIISVDDIMCNDAVSTKTIAECGESVHDSEAAGTRNNRGKRLQVA